MKRWPFAVLCLALPVAAEEPSHEQDLKVRITGLFAPDRVEALETAVAGLPDITLVHVDFDTTEATFRFQPSRAFPGSKPEHFVEQLDGRVRSASRHTLGVRAPGTVPREKLKHIEIPVAGLDCKACALGAYEAIYRMDGVEQATADFKAGLVTALIDPAKTDAAKLAATLRSRGVEVKVP
jgi:copper chaperone CopZ